MHKFMTFYTLDFLEGRMEAKVVLIYFLQYIPDAYIFFVLPRKKFLLTHSQGIMQKSNFPRKNHPHTKL